MSAVRARHKKSLAYTLAFAVILTLVIPFGGIAIASHSTEGTHTLDVEPESDTNALGTTHTLTATVTPNSSGAGTSCDNTCEVDFEVESGPTVRVNCVPQPNGTCTGGTSDSDNSPTSPDMTCFVSSTTPSQTECSVFFTSDTQGDNIVRGWVDDGGDNSSFDADQTEGVTHTATGQGGQRTDPDDTDVVSKTWFSAATGSVRLDCDDAGPTTPTTSALPSDDEVNPVGGSELYTCRAWTEVGGTANQFDSGTDTPLSGMNIDAEQQGANDPDNLAFNAATTSNTTADFNNACTTGSDGTCTFTLTPTRNEVGVAQVCFWLDEDNDTGFVNGGGTFDGGDCVNETFSETEGNDQLDTVQKEWAAAQAEILDAEPERDSNVKGTSHTVTATVTDQFGNPIQNVPVDFNIVSGANVLQGRICNQVLTNASGVATCTYTDSTTVVGSEPESDVIEACVDANPANNVCDESDLAVDESGATEFANLGDRVEKFWFTTLPVASTVIVDMDVDLDTRLGCDTDDPTTATNTVNQTHELCAIARNASGQPLAGVNVTFTLSGPGQFILDTDADDAFDTGEERGESITVTTDSSGRAFAELHSTQAGTTTVTATSGSATDTGTKAWASLAAGNARTLDCAPETDVNPTGTTHVVTCTALDRFGNPISGESIALRETGAGRISSPTGACATATATAGYTVCSTTAGDGTLEVILSTTSGEEGSQTLLAALEADVDDPTPLSRADNNEGTRTETTAVANDECDALAGQTPAGATQTGSPEGVCADEVGKTWDDDPTPDPECDDGIDNDGDGEIDFPDDPGCESAADNDERDFVVPAECTGEGIIAGTDGADVLTGTAGDDIICGFGGNDTLNGLGGNDVLLGGGGDDELNGGGGADSIEGDVVAACLQTGCAPGNDTADGGGAKDTIRGDAGNDLLLGGNKNDLIVGGQGNDTIRGQKGWDTIRGNAGDDRMIGNAGNDILQGGTGNDLAKGGAGDDTIRGFVGRDNLRGGGGDDIIKGAGGRDQLRGGRGNDILDGGAGRDACFGGPGDDTLRRCE